MTSISVSDYRRKCAEYIREALKRPRMHYRSLEELEAILSGHQIAFEQLGVIGREESFHQEFVEWLRRTRQAPGSAGWACAIKSLTIEEADPEQLFGKLVEEFLEQWEDCKRTA